VSHAARVQKLLDDAEPEARRLAAQELPKVRGSEAAGLLVRALGDEDWRVRKEAATVVASIEARDAVLRALRRALDDKVNIGLRNAAVEALVAIGPDAIPTAIEALDTLDEDGRKLAVEALAGIPDVRGTMALARALGDADPNVRVAAAEALGRAAPAGEEARELAIDALVAALGKRDTMLQLASLDALTRLEARLSWRTVEPFAGDPILKRYALSAAAASREIDAIRALAEAVGDPSPMVAREAVIALGEAVLADPYDDQVIEAASKTMAPLTRAKTTVRAMAQGEEDARVRGAAITALGLLRDPNDVGTLVEALSDPELADRAEVALKVFGEEALDPMLEAGRTANSAARGATLSIAPQIAPSTAGAEGEVLAVMREALRDPSVDVLLAAMRVFGRSGDASDMRDVASFTLHRDPRVADAAAGALHELAGRCPEEARALLGEIDASRPEAVIGCVAIAALAAHGHATPDADVTFLQGALSNGDPRARRAAVDALAMAALAGAPPESGRPDTHARAADVVSFALADEEPDVVHAAVRALGRLRRPEPLVALLHASREPTTIAAALRALAEADRDRALRVALPLVKSHDSGIASAAVEALGALSGAARDDALFVALEHQDTEVVKLALSELGRPSPESRDRAGAAGGAIDARSLTRIGLALDHAARDVRRLAAELLGQDGSASAHALLRARLEREKDVAVRVAIATALSQRTSRTEESR
jgi:HEAT repeat protein